MSKQIVVHLKDLRRWALEHDHFQVEKVENSVKFAIGQPLSTDEVMKLIDDDYKVVVTK